MTRAETLSEDGGQEVITRGKRTQNNFPGCGDSNAHLVLASQQLVDAVDAEDHKCRVEHERGAKLDKARHGVAQDVVLEDILVKLHHAAEAVEKLRVRRHGRKNPPGHNARTTRIPLSRQLDAALTRRLQ